MATVNAETNLDANKQEKLSTEQLTALNGLFNVEILKSLVFGIPTLLVALTFIYMTRTAITSEFDSIWVIFIWLVLLLFSFMFLRVAINNVVNKLEINSATEIKSLNGTISIGVTATGETAANNEYGYKIVEREFRHYEIFPIDLLYKDREKINGKEMIVYYIESVYQPYTSSPLIPYLGKSPMIINYEAIA